MATEAQILANRSNAQKSTGPRTAEGKAVVSRNAVKHGLCGREIVVTGEDLGEFEFYRERMLEELDPAGPVESGLAERIVGLSWRLQRAERLQTVAFDSLYAKQKDSLCEKLNQDRDADGDSTLGRAIVRDFANNRVLDRLLMYERRIEHSLYRTMAEFKRHRILQEVGPGQMWELRRAMSSGDDAGRENHGRDAPAAEPAGGGSAHAPQGGSGGDCGEGVVRARREAVLRTEATYEEPAAGTRADCEEPACAGVGGHGRDARATGRPGVVASDEGRATRPPAETLHASPFMLHDLSRKTKPISSPGDPGQAPCGKEVMADLPQEGLAETKPMGRTGCAVTQIGSRSLSGRPWPDGFGGTEDTLKLRLGVAPAVAPGMAPTELKGGLSFPGCGGGCTTRK